MCCQSQQTAVRNGDGTVLPSRCRDDQVKGNAQPISGARTIQAVVDRAGIGGAVRQAHGVNIRGSWTGVAARVLVCHYTDSGGVRPIEAGVGS